MSALGAILSRGLGRLNSLLDTPTFFWKGIYIPCVPSSLQRGTEVQIGGNFVQIGLTLFVKLDQFLSADDTLTVTADSSLITIDDDRPVPVAGQLVTYLGKNYRVLTAKLATGGSHVELHLADAASGELE